jgi:hypothetical protein
MAKVSKIVDASTADINFLRTELHTGLTLARLALSADRKDKHERNRMNARKAYDAVLRFAPRIMLRRDEAKEIKSRLSELKSDLQSLGEDL